MINTPNDEIAKSKIENILIVNHTQCYIVELPKILLLKFYAFDTCMM